MQAWLLLSVQGGAGEQNVFVTRSPGGNPVFSASRLAGAHSPMSAAQPSMGYTARYRSPAVSDATSSSGFIIFETENITISDVSIFNSDMGVVSYFMTGGGAVSITDSQISGSPTAGIYNMGGVVTVTDTVISDGYWGAITYPYLDDATTIFSGGGIKDVSQEAFYVVDTEAPYSAAATTINNANITGNTYGDAYTGPASIDATCNWWGASSGPSDAGSGTGDAVSTGPLGVILGIGDDECAREGPLNGIDRDAKGTPALRLHAAIKANCTLVIRATGDWLRELPM